MAYSTITKPSLHFNTKLYAGTGSTNNVTGVGFQPDWTWIKSRTDTGNHRIYDAVRGATKTIYSNLTNEEGTNTNGLSSFDSDGFTVNTNTQSNGSGNNFASWNWKAGGTGSSNTDGSITSTVSANTTAGFSIVSYTGTGANATVGHGLGTTPSMIIAKNRSATGNWRVYHKSLGANYLIQLDLTGAALDNATWNDTAPTSSVFSISSVADVNGSGNNIIAYCFAEKKGYSKFGSYTGNGNANGTFVYTGFKPAFIMAKTSSQTGNWFMWDNKRPNEFNLVDSFLEADGNVVEYTSNANHSIDILSNGFKMRGTGGTNNSGRVNIYMAFAEEPLVANVGASIPATAR